MAERFSELNPTHIEFIQNQHIFFVATARSTGTVNVSPKGSDSLRILAPDQLVWLNLTGSGNESAAHILESSRMTLMFCSFEKQPLILRLYGSALAVHPRDPAWQHYVDLFPADCGARQIFIMTLEQVQTSCGYAVPYYAYQGERNTLHNWSGKKGLNGIRQYWEQKNQISLDGFETLILDHS
ncbi:MAG: pyridoxamine 5'-phosphate oxidase family protein [Pseudomonadales bacterium]|nr:pyridoxamine 5'-phosphate oxidase family protein [Pseudomonadales bacterium]